MPVYARYMSCYCCFVIGVTLLPDRQDAEDEAILRQFDSLGIEQPSRSSQRASFQRRRRLVICESFSAMDAVPSTEHCLSCSGIFHCLNASGDELFTEHGLICLPAQQHLASSPHPLTPTPNRHTHP